jgi:hypothetical protein
MQLLEGNLPLYLQMMDPTLAGPAEPEALKIFAALNGDVPLDVEKRKTASLG